MVTAALEVLETYKGGGDPLIERTGFRSEPDGRTFKAQAFENRHQPIDVLRQRKCVPFDPTGVPVLRLKL